MACYLRLNFKYFADKIIINKDIINGFRNILWFIYYILYNIFYISILKSVISFIFF